MWLQNVITKPHDVIVKPHNVIVKPHNVIPKPHNVILKRPKILKRHNLLSHKAVTAFHMYNHVSSNI